MILRADPAGAHRLRECRVGAILASIFRFFLKLWKIENHAPALAGCSRIVVEDVSGTQKASIFRSILHWIFMFFPNPSQRSFLEGRRAKLARKCRFGSDFRFPWVPKSTFGGTFSTKNAKKVESSTWGGAPWSRPGRDLRPKTVQGCIFTDLGWILNRFWMDLGWFVDDFWCDFGPIWNGFWMICRWFV